LCSVFVAQAHDGAYYRSAKLVSDKAAQTTATLLGCNREHQQTQNKNGPKSISQFPKKRIHDLLFHP
jgi:hypothetical protein